MSPQALTATIAATVPPPGRETDAEPMPLRRACAPGTYDLYVSVGRRDGTPLYELPYEGCDGHKRYKIGQITLAGDGNNTESFPY